MATAATINSFAKSWLSQQIAKGKSKIFTETVELTPMLAEELLAINDDNRPISKSRVNAYMHDIIAGNWALNGETIIISRDGRMNDGQHRCRAVINANQSIPVVLIFGLDRESRLTTNQGKAKGAGDYAGMLGIDNARGVTAVARMVLTWKDARQVTGSRAVSHADTLAFLRENEARLQDAYRLSRRMYKTARPLGACAVLGSCFYLCAEIDEAAATAFFAALENGHNLNVNDPILTARNRLFAMHGDARTARFEIIIRAWNAWREGRALRMVPVTGTIPEPA